MITYLPFLCLLKRVIDLIVLNHYILHDNNAVRITCQELFLLFKKSVLAVKCELLYIIT